MEIALICLLIVVIVLACIIIFILFKKKDAKIDDKSSDLFEKIGKLENEIGNLKESTKDSLSSIVTDKFSSVQTSITNQLVNINNAIGARMNTISNNMNDTLNNEIKLLNSIHEQLKNNIDSLQKSVNESITRGFDTSNNNVKEVIKSLETLKSATSSLEKVGADIQTLNETLSFSKPSGKFGEQVLESVLRSVFGDTRDIYDLQYTINNDNDESKRVIADAVIHLPDPIHLLCIDSKFSFVKFKALFTAEQGENTKALKSEFKAALKTEINKIAASYIIKDKTASYALMFIPNDGIFAYIESDDDLYQQVVEYAYNKRVILTSPATLQPILANLNLFRIKEETIANIATVLDGINKVKKYLSNYQSSWLDISKAIDALSKKRDDFSKKVKTLDNSLNSCLTNPDAKLLLDNADAEIRDEDIKVED